MGGEASQTTVHMLRRCADVEAKGEVLAVDRFSAPTVSTLARCGLINIEKVGQLEAVRVELTDTGREMLETWSARLQNEGDGD